MPPAGDPAEGGGRFRGSAGQLEEALCESCETSAERRHSRSCFWSESAEKAAAAPRRRRTAGLQTLQQLLRVSGGGESRTDQHMSPIHPPAHGCSNAKAGHVQVQQDELVSFHSCFHLFINLVNIYFSLTS